MGIPKPVSFVPTLSFRHKFRWTFAAGYATNVSSDDILNYYLVATAATTTARIIAAARIRRISIWGQPPVLGAAPVSASIEWKGTNSNNTTVADTSSGIAPAYVTSTPPKGSSPSFWWDDASTDTVLFLPTVPLGGTCDIEMDLRLVDNASAAISGPATTGATLGKIYGSTINGLGAAAAGSQTPIGLNLLP
jgi:hypothetical protein